MKLELNNLNSGYNINTINVNFGKIETEFKNKVVYRDEESPMARNFDMNGFRVINLPNPVNNGDAVSYGFLLNSNAFTFTGLEYKNTWQNNTLYAKNNYVTVGGFVYIALQAHTSGVDFATDLAAGKWQIFSAGGGDLLSSNNLNDLSSFTLARANLNVPTRTGGDASGNWNINAATATLAATATVAINANNADAVDGVSSEQLAKQTSATGSTVLSVGTTAQRDATPFTGYFRYNTTIPQLEFYNGTSWQTANSSVADGDKGDITVSSGGTNWTIDSNTVTRQKATADLRSGLAQAWVNFNGTGTIAIRQAYNVSSISDNGVGDYTINFTSPMADANYVVAVSATLMPGSLQVVAPCIGRYNNTVIPKAASNCIISLYPTGQGTGTSSDSPYIDVAIFR